MIKLFKSLKLKISNFIEFKTFSTKEIRHKLLVATIKSDKYTLHEKITIINNLDDFLGIKEN